MKTSYWVKIIPIAHNAPQSAPKGDNTNSGRFFSPFQTRKTGIIYRENKLGQHAKKYAISLRTPDKARDASLSGLEILKSNTINLLITINIKSAFTIFTYPHNRALQYFDSEYLYAKNNSRISLQVFHTAMNHLQSLK
ncbi:hypothetical protein [Iodobacter fluviatilis]|uniref:Uncharacterized protein n=1 Tax=Iodobacter fluviatilis TaxID=537 RepID=A0A377Q2U6_9NEIS|nr:hypothetical protein [Iodobacter fluviatilis]TCU90023.1 hypothetical protein EV682_10142 [Iodobacter fluviatilis]STQ89050.1 Uncharacterised protein [Iodobacter fluviatilis]